MYTNDFSLPPARNGSAVHVVTSTGSHVETSVMDVAGSIVLVPISGGGTTQANPYDAWYRSNNSWHFIGDCGNASASRVIRASCALS